MAKNISNFKLSVETNGGYYIGRYETRTTIARNSKDDALTQITEKEIDQVYNYVTQLQAANQSQNMYCSSNFINDLMNSYARDTAILFLQNCGTNTKYSKQNSLNKSLLQIETTDDKQCNVYDMASSVREWTTETSSHPDYSCVNRGGNSDRSELYTSNRDYYNTSYSNYNIGFRPLLYVNV